MVELQDPRDLMLDGATKNLLLSVSEAIEDLEAHRPFTPDVALRLKTALLPDRIAASLNMEGIVATRRQTLAVMDAMRVTEVFEKSEKEIFNALSADEFIHDAVERGLVLNEGLIREVHGILLAGIADDSGQFRVGRVDLPGAPFAPPEGIEVPAFIESLCASFSRTEALHSVIQAAWLHAQFTMIHPFSDGNGRVGRLLQDYALVRRGLLPVGIPSSRRDDYYSALESSDKGSWDKFVELVAFLELDAISRTVAIAREPERRRRFIENLATAAAQQQRNTRHRNYVVWRQRMEAISHSFEQVIQELDEASAVIGAEFRGYGAPDFAEWRQICERGYIDRNWLFSMLFFAEGHPVYKTVAYLRRHVVRQNTDPFRDERDLVSLYFSGSEPQERPDLRGGYSDPHIRLRELLFVDDTLHTYRQESPDEDWTCTVDQTTEDVIQEYLLDVFSRKFGIGVVLDSQGLPST